MVDIIGGGDELLRTGMQPREAVEFARRWWNKKGRDQFRSDRDRKRDGIKGDEEIMHKSGLLKGLPWDELTQVEQRQIIKVTQDELYQLELEGKL